jgi:RNA recognition motif-containing protein
VKPRITRTLYVGGFGAVATAGDLRELFAQHGEVAELRLVDRGEASFAYVTFVAEADAVMARVHLDGTEFAGRTLRVERAQ